MGAGGQLTTTTTKRGERNNALFEMMNDAHHVDDTVFIVGAYTRCELLAHTPMNSSSPTCNDDFDDEMRYYSVGNANDVDARAGVHVVCLDGATGQLEMATTNNIGPNVAFVTRHPTKPDVIYASTERIDVEGEVVTMRLTRDLRLKEIARCSAGGKSTCYLNFNKSNTYMMSVNYWDAKLALMHLDDLGLSLIHI